jgi:succinate dehydrogenase/fumarate reductase flavoprotein subunit
MQYFASEYKTERLLKMGLEELERIEKEAVPNLFALNPHMLMRSIEDLSMIENAKIIIHAMLARKASSIPLGLSRIDYPQIDPPEWNKYLT